MSPRPTIHELLTAAASVCEVSESDMLASGRTAEAIYARRVYVCAAREVGFSFPETAAGLSRGESSSVQTMYRRVMRMEPEERAAMLDRANDAVLAATGLAVLRRRDAAKRLLVEGGA